MCVLGDNDYNIEFMGKLEIMRLGVWCGFSRTVWVTLGHPLFLNEPNYRKTSKLDARHHLTGTLLFASLAMRSLASRGRVGMMG